jgi:hypothetical protein
VGLKTIGRLPGAPKKLKDWVVIQRSNRKNLSAERVRLLEEIGLEWNSLEEGWNRKYEELKEFKIKHGHLNVPEKLSSLSGWVQKQRHGYMTPERRALLDRIGFLWNPIRDFWDEKFRELVSFHKKHGHIRIPQHKSTIHLNRWLSNMKSGHIPLENERIQRLKNAGFKELAEQCRKYEIKS